MLETVLGFGSLGAVAILGVVLYVFNLIEWNKNGRHEFHW